MSQTPVDIVNLALVKLGAQSVRTLDAPTTPIERRAQRLYPHLRDSELAKRRWRFAKKRATLVNPRLDNLGATHFDLPTDCLRALRDRHNVFELEGRELIAPGDRKVRIVYIARIAEDAFPEVFVEALVCKLAEGLAELITQSNEKKDRATQGYKDAIREASLLNAYEQGAELIAYEDSDSSFLTGRYGCGTTRFPYEFEIGSEIVDSGGGTPDPGGNGPKVLVNESGNALVDGSNTAIEVTT